nr:autotransporter-associated beta strand repeat-containing protein [Planctomycetota bacterium]
MALVLVLAGCSHLAAATSTWTGGGGDNNWTTAANWGGVAPVAGDALVFAGSTRLTPNVDFAAGTSFASITFDNTAGAFTIGGNRITITSAITNNSAATETLACDISGTYGVGGSSGPITLNGALGTGGLLTKSGTHTLTLGGTTDNNALPLTANAGTVILAKTSTSGVHAIGGATLTINGATVQLGGTGGDQLYDDATILVNSGTFDTNGRSEAFNTLSGAGIITNAGGGASVLTIGQTGGGSSITGTIQNSSGTLAMVKAGTGTMVLSGADTYSGGTTVSAGTVQATGSALGTGAVTVASGATLAVTGASGLSARYFNVSPASANFASLTALQGHLGSQTLALANTATTLNFGNTGSGFPAPYASGATNFEAVYSGRITIGTAGTYTFNTSSDDGSVLFVDGTLVVDNNFFQATATRTGSISLSTGVHDLVVAFYQGGVDYGLNAQISGAGNTTMVDISTANCTLTPDLIVGSLAGAGTVALTSGGVISGFDGTSTTFSGVLSGPGGLVKRGAGTLTLSGVNTYTGTTMVSAGTLTNGAAGVIADSNAVTVASGGTWNLANFNETVGSLAGAGSITLGSATLTCGGDATSTTLTGVISGTGAVTKTGAGSMTLSGVNTYTGATTVSTGTLTNGAAGVLADISAVTVASGATWNLANFNETVGSLAGAGSVTLGSATLTCGGDATSTTLSGVISGTGAVTKAGAGTMTLSGVNTYTGATTVSVGTLLVSGSTVAGSAVGVSSGATLGGTGTVAGTVALAAGSTLAPGQGGTAIGTLTTGSVTCNATSSLSLDLDGTTPTNDRESTAGTVACAGTLTVASIANAALAKVYTIVSAGTVSGTFSGLVNGAKFTQQGRTFQIAYTGTTVTLTDVVRSTTRVWDGGGADNNWTTGANWDFDLAPVAGEDLQFAGATRTAPNNDYAADTSFASITFNAGASAFTVGGNRLTLAGNVTNSSSAGQTVSAAMILGGATTVTATSNAIALSGVLSGTGSLTSTGVGGLTLGTNNVFSGGVTVSQGTVNAGGTGCGTGPVTVSAGATLAAGGASGLLARYYNVAPSAANFTSLRVLLTHLLAPQTIALENGATTLNFGVSGGSFPSPYNSGAGNLEAFYTGKISIATAGVYTFNTSSDDGSVLFIDGTLVVDNNFTQGVVTRSGTITLATGLHNFAMGYYQGNGGYGLNAQISGAGNTTMVDISTANVAITADLDVYSLAGAGTVSLTNGNLWVGLGNTSTTFSGVISGAGDVTKYGTGTLTLSGANTYTGTTMVSTGTLTDGAAGVIPDGSAVTVVSGGTWNLNNFNETIGSLAGGGTVTLGSGNLTMGGDNTSTTFTGAIGGTGGATKNGTGTYTAPNASTMTGKWVINAGLVGASSGPSFGTAPASYTADYITLNGGGIVYNATTTPSANRGITVAAGGGSLSAASGLVWGIATIVTGSGNVTIGTGGTGTVSLQNVNTFTGALSVSAGTLQNGIANPVPDACAVTVAAGAVYDLNGFSDTIGSLAGSGNVALGSATLTCGGDATSTALSGVISGTGAVTKAGAGTMTLSGVNTYTGATTVSAGTLTNGAAGVIADTSAVTVASGATWSLANFNETVGSIAGAGSITLGSATLTCGGDATSTTLSGVISGTGAVAKAGAGTMTLSGVNTYTGATTVSVGTLANGAAGVIADTSAVTVASGATWNLANFNETVGSIAGAGSITLGSATLTCGGDATSTTLSGVISGTGAVTKAGAGTMTLSGVNTYTGATTVSVGTLTNGAAGVIADTSAVTVASGATWNLANFNETVGSIAGAGSITLGSATLTCGGDATSTTLSGVISGTGAVAKAGAGTMTLSGVNTYTGTTTVSVGTLLVSGSTVAGSAVTVANGATLGGTGTVAGTVAMAAGSTLAPGLGGTAIGTLTTGSVTCNATSIFSLDLNGTTPTNDRVTTAGTATCAGTLTVASIANAAVGKVYTIVSAGTVSGTFSGLVNGAEFTQQSRTFQIAYTGTAVTLTDVARPTTRVWDGGGADNNWTTAANWDFDLAPIAGDDLQFAGATRTAPNNDFTAATSFASITFNSGASAFTVGGNAITLTGAVTNSSTALQTVNVALAVAATRTLDAASGNLALGGVASGAGGVTKAGTNVLTLSGVNTYTGATTVSAGTLTNGAAGVITDTSAVTVASGATWNLAGFNETVGSLAGAGSITLGSATLTCGGDATSTTLSGVISGTGAVTKAGAGTMTLSGVNTYTGATTVSVGTLTNGAAGVIADTSAVTVASGATWNLASFNETVGSLAGAGNITLGSATLTCGGDATSTTLSGVISGTGAVAKAGAGTWTLSGANTYTGTTTVSVGTVANGAAGVIADTSAVTVASGATWNLANFNETVGSLAGAGSVTLGSATLTCGGDATSTTLSGVISGTGAVAKAGAGTMTLSGANTYTGTTTVSVGTLLVSGSTVAGSAVTVANSATLGGTGTVAGTVALAAGSTLAPGLGGTAIGTLTTGSVTCNATSIFSLDLDGTTPTNDRETTAGTATCAGTLTIASIANATLAKVYTIVSAGTVSGTFSGLVNGAKFTQQGRTFQIAYTGTAVTLTDVARPTTRVWDGGGADNNWTTAANWDFDLAPIAGDDLQFAGATRLTPNNDFTAATSFASITFNSGASAFTVGGNAITLAGAVTNSGTTLQTLNLALAVAATRTVDAASGNLALGGVVSGVGGLTKAGTSVLTLSGVNTYTGATTVSAGTLTNGAAGVIADTSAVTVASGATWNLANFNETVGSLAGAGSITLGSATLTCGGDATSTTLSGVISGTGAVTKAGAGTMTLSGVNTYTGATTLSVGTLSNGAAGVIADTSAVTVASGATWNLANFNETVGSLAGAGSITLGSATLTCGGDATSTTLSGVISGTGAVTKAGAGTMTLSGASTYSGGTTISAGIIAVSTSNTALGSGAVTVGSAAGCQLSLSTTLLAVANPLNITGGSVAGQGALQFTAAGTATYSGAITITANTAAGGHFASTGGGVLTLSGAITSSAIVVFRFGSIVVSNIGSSYAAATITQATLSLGATNALPTTCTVALGQSGTSSLDLAGFDQTVAAVTRAANTTTINSSIGTPTLTVATTAPDSYDGTIIGSLALVKTGASTLTLAGANTYTGSTTVSAGTLLVSGSTAAGSAVSVSNGATLGGTGTVSGTVALAAGSTLAPGLGGTAIGTLTTGTVTCNATSILSLDLDGTTPTNDRVTTAGTVACAGTLTVASIANAALAKVYTIVSAGTVSGTFSGLVNGAKFTQQGRTFQIAYTGTAVTLTDVARPTTRVWDGGGADNNWTTAANWDFDLAPVAGDDLQFAGSTRTAPNNDFAAATSFASITFNSGASAFTVGGNAITLAGAVTNSGTTLQTLNLALAVAATRTVDAASGDLALGGVVSGVGGLTKAGTNVLTLSGVNTYTGATTVSAGTLTDGAAGVIADTSAVTVASGATWNLANFNETVGSLAGAGSITLGSATLTCGGDATSTTLSGVISGTGAMTKAGAGTMTLSGVNTYTGATTVSVGTLTNGAAGVIADTSAVTVASGATWNLANFNESVGSLAGAGSITLGSATLTCGGDATSTTLSGVISGTGAVAKAGAGTMTLSGANTYTGTTTVSVGTVLVSGSTVAGSAVTVANGATLGGTGTVAGTVALAAGSTLAPGLGGTAIGTLTTGSVTCNATSIFSLDLDGTTPTNDRETTAGTATCAGTLTIASIANAALAKVYTIVSAGTVSGTFSGLVNGAKFTQQGRTFQIAYTGTAVTLTDVVRPTTRVWDGGGADNNWTTAANWDFDLAPVAGDDLQFAGSTRTSPNNDFTAATSFSSITFNSGASAFTVGGNAITLAGAVTNSGTALQTLNLALAVAATRTVDAASGDLVMGGVVSGVGGLTKAGTNVLTLSGVNTYTGATTVSVGTVLVSGSTAAGSAVSVSNGATLGGTGTVAGTIALAAGSTLSPGLGGTAIGTLTTGSVTCNATSIFSLDLDGTTPTNDRVTTAGTVACAGTLTVASIANAALAKVYTIVSAGTVSGTFSGLVNGAKFTQQGRTFQIAYTGTAVTLTDVARPTTRVWDGGGADNNWTTAANWDFDLAPVAGDDLQFAGSTRTAPN